MATTAVVLSGSNKTHVVCFREGEAKIQSRDFFYPKEGCCSIALSTKGIPLQPNQKAQNEYHVFHGVEIKMDLTSAAG